MKRLNTKGFSIIEAVIIVFVLVTIGGVAYYVGGNKDKKTSTSQTPNSKPTEISNISKADSQGMITFKDLKDGVTFKYPSDWKFELDKPEERYEQTLSGTIISPSGKASLRYTNFIAGVGGGSCPESYPCPTVHVLSVKEVVGAEDTKLIEKITDWKGNGDSFTPSFGLVDTQMASNYPVGSKAQNDFYIRVSFGDSGGTFSYHMSPDSRPESGFKTYAEAKAFLESPEVLTAKQILLSVIKQ